MVEPVATRRGERKGDILGGKYLLEDCLGIGGMGEVYRATNVSLGRKVAIKLLSEKYVDREDDVLRFLREARAAAAIRHTHVVDVLDVARDEDGTPFIVQELLDGEDLEQYLRIRNGRLSPEEAVEIMLPVADAVAAAHAQQVVHRDLKPANIFLARDRNKITPKVLDFGACLFPTMGERSAKDAQTFIGTPHYMAPEQIVARDTVDARSDVWALGIILWEIMVGETPFEAPTATEVLKLVKSREVPLLRTRAPKASADLELLVARCTARDRAARHPDASAVHQNLLEVRRKMQGAPAVSRKETLTELPESTPSLFEEKRIVLAPAKKEPPPRAGALKMTLNDPFSEPPGGFGELDFPPSNALRPPLAPRAELLAKPAAPPLDAPPLELAARPSSWPPHHPPSSKSGSGGYAVASSLPPVLAPANASRNGPSSLPPVLAPANASRNGPSSLPPVLAPANASRNGPSSLPPVLATANARMEDAAPPSIRPGPPVSAGGLRIGPAAAAAVSSRSSRSEKRWRGAEVFRLAALISLPAVAAFLVVRLVPVLGAPVGSALRGDSTLASGVLAVVALVAGAALCARSVLGEKSRWLYFAAGGGVLFGIVMIIVTFSASEAAELGVPASMAGLSTSVAPIAPFLLGLAALAELRTRWLDPYSRSEALRSAAIASAMLFLILALGPLGVAHTHARTHSAAHSPAHPSTSH